MTNEPANSRLVPLFSEKVELFEMAFRQYSEILYRHAFKKTNSIDLSRDLVQEVFFTLWEKQDKFPEQEQILPYLYNILKNKILNQYKKSNVHLRYAISVAKQNDAEGYTSHDLFLNKELQSIITEEVNKMPGRMKVIYLLKKEENKSIKEIATELNISEQTVKNQLQTAYNRMKTRLTDYNSPSLFVGSLIYLMSMLNHH